MVDVIKSYIMTVAHGKLSRFIFRPVQSPLLDYTEHELFDLENPHLEYFPLVNQRVFSIGSQDTGHAEKQGQKEILNYSFKDTYIKFLHLALHQEQVSSGQLYVSEKQKLQLAYYLQLQDRVSEAIIIYKCIDIAKLQADGNDQAC